MVALRGKEGRLRHRFDLAGAGGLGTDAEGVERRDSCTHILSKHSGARDRRAFRHPRRAVRTIFFKSQMEGTRSPPLFGIMMSAIVRSRPNSGCLPQLRAINPDSSRVRWLSVHG